MTGRTMSLPIQSFRLSEVAEAGMDWAGVAGAESGGTPAVQAIGECFAFHNQPLDEEANREGVSWHVWLLRRAVIGLWEERSRNKVYVCFRLAAFYEAAGQYQK
jgi:hypothetical protein